MEKEQRVFLAYRAVFEGNNAQIRQPKAIKKLVLQHRKSARTLLQSLGENQVIDTLKTLLEQKVFQSELEAKLRFPKLFTISSSRSVQHIASEADAARSEAEALDDVASLNGNDEDDAQDEIKAGAPASLITAGIQTQTTGNVVQVPSLYPIYIPFKTQHLVLSKAQSLLEECCYEFTAQWLPELLEQRHWDCPEAIELNKWTYVMVKRLGKLPSQAFARDSDLSLGESLTSINKLRHSAVHRLPTTAKGISEMIRSAQRFATSLRDPIREQQFDELKDELEGKIRALELNKNFLETKLEGELQDIARQRRELDEKEKEAIVTMLREDKDHGSLIGGLLSTSINQILCKLERQEPEVREAEASSDYETEANEERKHAEKDDLTHQAKLQLSSKEQSVSNRNTEHETHESKPGLQPYVKTFPVLASPDMSSQSQVKESIHDDLHPEIQQPWILASQPILDLESEVTGLFPETKERTTESDVNVQQQESIEQDPCESGVLLEVQNLLPGTLPQEVYRAYTKAVDVKLGTYDFGTGGYSKLSDKRLRRICQFVKEQTNLDTALHQTELDNLIRARFATFESEKRQRTNTTSKKKKKSKQSTTNAEDTFSKPWNPVRIDSPPGSQPVPLQGTTTSLQPLHQALRSRSPSPLKESSSPSYLFAESFDASEPKTYQLTAVGDPISSGRLGLLWIDDHGRVEGKMIVDKSGISLI